MLSKIQHILNWPVLCLALVLALGMWYTVTVRDRLEAQLEVRLDYKNVPENLVVIDGLVSKVSTRLRGPAALIRAIDPQTLIQVINLSHLKKGSNTIPLVPEDWRPAFRAFEVVEVVPARLHLQVDSLVDRTLPVQAQTQSSLGANVLNIVVERLEPAQVQVRGPESVITHMQTQRVLVPVDAKIGQGQYTHNVPLEVPPLVTVVPTSVRVQYAVTSGRVNVSMEKNIQLPVQERRVHAIHPERLRVLVEVPESLEKNASYLDKIRLSTTAPLLEVDESATVPLHVDLPEGMILREPLPAEVTVTRIKK